MRVGVNFKTALMFLALVIVPIIFYVLGGEATRIWWVEAGLVETISALGFVAGFVFAARSAYKSTGWLRAHFIFWALLCLISFGEETSWLQHYLNYSTPEAVASRNAQGEFNLHNLDFFQGGYLLGPEGSFNVGSLLKSQHIFQMGFVIFFLLLPFASTVHFVKNLLTRFKMPHPDVRFSLIIWIPILVSIGITFISIGATKSAIAETREMFYALAIGSFLILASRQLRAVK